MTTKRCNATERAVFHRRSLIDYQSSPEPALGTLDERLNIIIQRQGGKIGAVRMTDRERREYQQWLTRNGLAS